MSHIVQAKTTIVNPDMNLLRKACEIVASAHEGTVEKHILNFSDRQVPVNSQLAVFTQRVRRGIGIHLTGTGEMEFTGDDWGYSRDYENLKSEVLKTFVSLATAKALSQMGYTPQADEDGQQMVIRGTMYA